MRLVSLVWLPKQWRFGFHRQCLAVVLTVDDKQDLFEMMFVELSGAVIESCHSVIENQMCLLSILNRLSTNVDFLMKICDTSKKR